MSAYDGPAADPGSVSALAATLERCTSRLADAAEDARRTDPHLTSRLRDLDRMLAALGPLPRALQEHAAVLADTRTTWADDATELTLQEARRRADATALRRVLDQVVEVWDDPGVSPPPPPAGAPPRAR